MMRYFRGVTDWCLAALMVVGLLTIQAIDVGGFGEIYVSAVLAALLVRLALSVAIAWAAGRRRVVEGVSFATPALGVSRPVAEAVVGVASSELRSIARHEAAHAVVSMGGGGIVEVAHVIPEGRFSGGVVGTCPADWSVADNLWLRLKVALAGNLVDLGAGIHDESSTSDWMRAWAIASALASCGERPAGCVVDEVTPGSFIEAAWADAARCLQVHHGWVDRVADALCQRRRLVGDEVAALRSGDLR